MIELKNIGKPNENELLMTAGEVADYLKVSVSAVRRWTRSGFLKGHRLGGNGDWRYFKKDVMVFLCGVDY